MSSIDEVLFESVPVFNLQNDHDRVSVPTSFDLRDLSRKHSVFPIRTVTHNQQDCLVLAMVNPFDQVALSAVEERCALPVIVVRADRDDIKWLIQVHYYGLKLSPLSKADENQQDWLAKLTALNSNQARPD